MLNRSPQSVANLRERVTNTDGASTACVGDFAAVAGKRKIVTQVIGVNTSATDGYVDLRDGTGGAVLASIPLPAGGGANVEFVSDRVKTTAGNALAYDVSGALTTVILTFFGRQE